MTGINREGRKQQDAVKSICFRAGFAKAFEKVVTLSTHYKHLYCKQHYLFFMNHWITLLVQVVARLFLFQDAGYAGGSKKLYVGIPDTRLPVWSVNTGQYSNGNVDRKPGWKNTRI
jgi:hypothetical protein